MDFYKKYTAGGMPMFGFCPPENLEKIRVMEMNPKDVIVAGYPKSGSTWTYTRICAILAADGLQRFEAEGFSSERSPLEFLDTYDLIQRVPRPTVILTHLKYNMLPKQVEAKQIKVVYVVRNPKDTAVSYYHFSKNLRFFGFSGSWEEYLPLFLTGDVAWGSWFEYQKDWLQYVDKPNLLLVTYEESLQNPKASIRRIAEFLNKDLTDEQVAKIADLTSADTMRADPKFDDSPRDVKVHKGDRSETYTVIHRPEARRMHIRKAKIGDWKNHFSPEQLQNFYKVYSQYKNDIGLDFVFE